MKTAAKNKPCIVLAAAPHAQLTDKLREIAAGMEEEGIPWRQLPDTDGEAVTLARRAAEESALGVGIGVGERGLCVHYSKLPPEKPLFQHADAGDAPLWRLYGSHAARLVKGLPFRAEPVRQAETESADKAASRPQPGREGDLSEAVAAVVRRLLMNANGRTGEVKV